MDLAEINRQKIMQLATQKDGQPWACTVYFVLYGGCFYWLSYPDRRHSRELAKNPRAAVAIALKQDLPVIGLQAEGDVELVEDVREIEAVLPLYVGKYGSGREFVERYKAGVNRHGLYKFSPRKVVLFDELNFPENPSRTISLSD
jgi:uncharacterized protein YhbP (UPF0306 family)